VGLYARYGAPDGFHAPDAPRTRFGYRIEALWVMRASQETPVTVTGKGGPGIDLWFQNAEDGGRPVTELILDPTSTGTSFEHPRRKDSTPTCTSRRQGASASRWWARAEDGLPPWGLGDRFSRRAPGPQCRGSAREARERRGRDPRLGQLWDSAAPSDQSPSGARDDHILKPPRAFAGCRLSTLVSARTLEVE
jgi:hypothetical protein